MPARSRTVKNDPDEIERRHVELRHPVLESVLVRVRRNRRTRHVRLHIDEHGEVTASVPARFAAARIDPIVRERADWLHEVLVRMEMKSRDTQVDLERGEPVRWLGRWVPSTVERGARRSTVRLEDDRLVLRLTDEDDPHEALVAWYRREARVVFEERVAHWCDAYDITPGKVSIREQRTRWGSCTHRGDLSFNWRLVLAPLWVLDSIVVHELCHIEELNHSDDFWALLDDRFPRHEEASEWLREHGAALRVTRPDTEKTRLGTARVRTAHAIEPAEPAATAAGRLLRARRGRRGARPSDEQISLFSS